MSSSRMSSLMGISVGPNVVVVRDCLNGSGVKYFRRLE